MGIVKVKYKFDIHGVGHDQAEQHKFKWWERAFETAAAAIEVGDDNKIQRTGKSGPVVSTALPVSRALNRAMLYGRFIKKGTMEGGKFKEESEDSDSSSDDDDIAAKIGQVVEVSDAELFKRCGGLTGHKGARHGHNMTAKLDRLKKTEEEGIKRLEAVRKQQAERKAREDQTENTHELPLFEGDPVAITRLFDEPPIDSENNVIKENGEEKKKNKKKKKKKSKVSEEEAVVEEEEESVEKEDIIAEKEEVIVTEKPKKKKKSKVVTEEEKEEEPVVEEKPKKKKKKSKAEESDESEPVKKKKKKSSYEEVVEAETPKKKSKKKKKSAE